MSGIGLATTRINLTLMKLGNPSIPSFVTRILNSDPWRREEWWRCWWEVDG